MTKSKKYAKYLQEQRNKISELVIKFTLFAEMIKRKARGGGGKFSHLKSDKEGYEACLISLTRKIGTGQIENLNVSKGNDMHT